MNFDGETFEQSRDGERLQAQLDRVHAYIRDGQWHTLKQIALACRSPESSVSARLRDLRKDKFGGHVIERRYVVRGLFEYRLRTEPVQLSLVA